MQFFIHCNFFCQEYKFTYLLTDQFIALFIVSLLKIKYYFSSHRSSHQRCSIKKGVLRNVAKFTGKHLCQGLFSNKVAGLRPVTLLKERLWHRCFPVNFAKFLRTPFLRNTSGGYFCTLPVSLKITDLVAVKGTLTPF